MGATEGSAAFYFFGQDQRFQQIDETQVGFGRVITSIAFRRDSAGGGTAASARSFDFSVTVAHGDLASVSGDPDRNRLGPVTVALPSTRVNFPAWSTPPTTPPAPFDFVVPFATPAVYLGTGALVLDFTVLNSTSTTNITMDRHGGSLAVSAPNKIGTGCLATGRAASFEHTLYLMNDGPAGRIGMRLVSYGKNAPVGNALLLIGTAPTTLPVQGLCAPLQTLPIAQVDLGPSVALTGTVPFLSFGIPYAPSLLGAQLVTQLAALDVGQPGLPIVVSNGVSYTMPTTGSQLVPGCCYLWTYPTSAAQQGTALPVFGGGAVIRIG